MNLKTNILNAAFLASALLAAAPAAAGMRGDHVATEQQARAAGNAPIEGIRQLNPAAVEVLFTDGRRRETVYPCGSEQRQLAGRNDLADTCGGKPCGRRY